jgi:hypothetical protein
MREMGYSLEEALLLILHRLHVNILGEVGAELKV